MHDHEKGQRVRFTDPRSGEHRVGTIVRVDRNDRPTGWAVSIIRTEEDVISVPNQLISPLRGGEE